MSARHYTNMLLELIDDGRIAECDVIMACVKYMSEDDVHDMMRCNNFFDEENEEGEDD